MSAKIGEYTEGHLLSVAKGIVQKKTADSVILDAHAEARIPKFDAKGAFDEGACEVSIRNKLLISLVFRQSLSSDAYWDVEDSAL
jgi:hypothetical protein